MKGNWESFHNSTRPHGRKALVLGQESGSLEMVEKEKTLNNETLAQSREFKSCLKMSHCHSHSCSPFLLLPFQCTIRCNCVHSGSSQFNEFGSPGECSVSIISLNHSASGRKSRSAAGSSLQALPRNQTTHPLIHTKGRHLKACAHMYPHLELLMVGQTQL